MNNQCPPDNYVDDGDNGFKRLVSLNDSGVLTIERLPTKETKVQTQKKNPEDGLTQTV